MRGLLLLPVYLHLHADVRAGAARAESVRRQRDQSGHPERPRSAESGTLRATFRWGGQQVRPHHDAKPRSNRHWRTVTGTRNFYFFLLLELFLLSYPAYLELYHRFLALIDRCPPGRVEIERIVFLHLIWNVMRMGFLKISKWSDYTLFLLSIIILPYIKLLGCKRTIRNRSQVIFYDYSFWFTCKVLYDNPEWIKISPIFDNYDCRQMSRGGRSGTRSTDATTWWWNTSTRPRTTLSGCRWLPRVPASSAISARNSPAKSASNGWRSRCHWTSAYP